MEISMNQREPIRLPSMEGTSNEEWKERFEKQRLRGHTTIEIGKFKLEVPDFAVENNKESLLTLSRKKRRLMRKHTFQFIEKFLVFTERPDLDPQKLEQVMEVAVKWLVIREAFRKIEEMS
jgi:hypothetical protein